jgi:hypothetical protein
MSDDECGGGGMRCALEPQGRFSRSVLWPLMRSFYTARGVGAFGGCDAEEGAGGGSSGSGGGGGGGASASSPTVPSFVTSNAAHAARVAALVRGAVVDLWHGGRLAGPSAAPADRVYVLEIGSGSGKFGFLFAAALAALRWPPGLAFAASQLTFVMSDVVPENIRAWRTVAALEAAAAAGRVDYALLDAGGGAGCLASIDLLVSGTRLSAAALAGGRGALILIANYVFDSLPTDAFRVLGNVLHEVTVSAGSRHAAGEPDPGDPGILSRLDNEWGAVPLPRAHGYYAGEGEDAGVLNAMLDWYREHLGSGGGGVAPPPVPAAATAGPLPTSSAAFLIPIGALRCIRGLRALCHGRLAVIVGDKGHVDPDAFRGAPEPHLAIHGSFSVMVNLHAVGLYFRARGGGALLCPSEDSSFSVSVFLPAGGGSDGGRDGGSSSSSGSGEPVVHLPALVGGSGGGSCAHGDEACGWFAETSTAYASSFGSFSPDDALVIHDALTERGARALRLRDVLALAGLYEWDADVVFKLRDAIVAQVRAAARAALVEC